VFLINSGTPTSRSARTSRAIRNELRIRHCGRTSPRRKRFAFVLRRSFAQEHGRRSALSADSVQYLCVRTARLKASVPVFAANRRACPHGVANKRSLALCGCWTIAPFSFAPGALLSVLANKAYRRERKECYEYEPQHKQHNLEDPLSLIKEAVPRKRKYRHRKKTRLISRHSIV
jgi:hypothetical protein